MTTRPLGLIYALDQDRRTTSSLGIYNYTARLIAALARRPDPGFDLEIHCTRANAADLIPSAAPAWLRAVVWRGRYSTGARRLWADHVLAWVLPLARRGSMGAHGLGTATVLRGFGYFLCLGLGFLFVEIVLIERFTYLLNDPALAFATVLSASLPDLRERLQVTEYAVNFPGKAGF